MTLYYANDFGCVVVVVAFTVGWSLPSTVISVNTKAIALVNTEIVSTEDEVKKQYLSMEQHLAVVYAGHGMAKGVNYTEVLVE